MQITGVRWAESPRRRQQWKQCQRYNPKKSHTSESWIVNPIVDWTDDDVWRFICQHKISYCTLYDEGFKRLGCVGCPMSGAKGVQRDFTRWPQYERAWRRSFHRLWNRRAGKIMTRGKRKGQQWPGLPGITTPDELFEWWKSGDSAPFDGDECQLKFWCGGNAGN